MEGFSYKDYLSYFTFRYGSKEMREIFSLYNLRITWRKIWTALAKTQMELGLLSKVEYEEIEKNKANLNLEKSFALEKELQHDLMAELKVYASQCPKGGGKIHLGATSTDILDNAEILCFKKALDLIKDKLILLLKEFIKFIENYKDLVCMGFTHLQSAEPITLGYRFSFYLQDLYLDLLMMKFLEKEIKTKGIKGAVGTSASFVNLFEGDFKKTEILEKKLIRELNLEAFLITAQTYPRKIDFWILNFLASLAQSLHKFAADLRIMQSFGELQEPFLKYQVGSSAMPFKKNPILAERICSLAEYIKVLPQVAWNNAADTLLERTLDDSANRRIIMSEAFLSLDEILILAEKIISKVKINQFNINKNLA
ncbi:MAG: adenylosuccinate lyase, partial [Armatimonadetes bacterium]|nr:adenylosuccinate lyase [Armatimonadota bacterium]